MILRPYSRWIFAVRRFRAIRIELMKRNYSICLPVVMLLGTLSFAPPAALPTGMTTLGDARILFVGDVMMGRQMNQNMAGNFEAPFVHVTDFLQSPDLTVANLEGPLVATANIPR